MRLKKIRILGCTAVMMAAMLTGCGEEKQENANSIVLQTDAGEDNDTDASGTDTGSEGTEEHGDTVSDDNAENLTEEPGNGEQPEVPDGEMPEVPDGEAPDGEMPGKPDGEAPDGEMPVKPAGKAPDGEMPEKPDGEAPDGETPGKPDGEAPNGETPEKPDGEAPNGEMPGKPDGEAPNGEMPGKPDGEAPNGEMPGKPDGEAPGGQPGGFGGSGEVTNGTSANTLTEDGTITGESYASVGDNENALRVDGAEVTLNGITVEKTAGASDNTEDGDFYGQNAALLVLNGAEVTINDAAVNTSTVNGNGVFSYGEGTVVNISNSTIRTTGHNSGGIQTTGGGTTNASNLDIETQGNSSAAIRSDRGGGTVNVDGGTYVTNGTGSPAVYSTAAIQVEDAVLTANASEGVVVEGKNSVVLTNCGVTGNMSNTYNGDSDENIHCIMIYQSMSGDAAVGEAYFSAEGGSITALAGDMFYITNTDCKIDLKDVDFTLANDIFLRVEGNSSSRGWGTAGANGGDVVLTTETQKITGNIIVDSISSLNWTMKTDTEFVGTINADGEGGAVALVLEDGAVWKLTGDSYITSLTGNSENIETNGYTLYVNGEAFN